MITHILMSWFKTVDSTKNAETTETQKISFPKEIIENPDLHRPVLDKKMSTQG